MKRTRTNLAFAALAAMGILAAGCGGDGGGSGGAPTSEQIQKVQQSEAGSGSLDELASISTQALIDDGAQGATQKANAPAGTAAASSTVIAYQENVSLVIDLDATDPNGNDLFPNATGQIGVAASGTLVGDPTSGSIDYAVVVTALTDIVLTDPTSACSATISAASTFAHQLEIAWSWTDGQNWTISAQCSVAIVDFVLTVTDGVETWTATVDCARTEGCTLSATAGQISLTCAVAGAKFVTLTDGVVTHFVAIDVVGIGGITITVDGAAFGPWSAARVRAVWGIDVN